jgi:pyridoxal phosphate enzyme (YggS family)
VDCVDVIHSIETLELAQAVARHATEVERRIEAFVQVNVSGEAAKSGFSPDAFRRHTADLAGLAGVHWRGLMTMAPEGADPKALRAIFVATRRLHEEARDSFGAAWDALSMGMTDDFEIAIEEGATHVRIGRAIFGQRAATIQAEVL